MTINYPHKIDLPFPHLSNRIDVKVKECYLVLQQRHLHYKIIANYTSLYDGIQEPLKANERWIKRRDKITKVIMFFCNSENRYQVEIEWGNDCSGWMFETQVQAKEFYDTMFDYMIGE